MRCVGQGGHFAELIAERKLDKVQLVKEIEELEGKLEKAREADKPDKVIGGYKEDIASKEAKLEKLNAEIKQLYEQNAGPSASVSLCSARRTVSGPPAPRRRHSLALGCSCSMCMPSCLLTRCVALSCCVCGGAPSIAPVGAGLAGGGGAAGAGAGAGGAAQGWSLVIRLACSAIPPAVSGRSLRCRPRMFRPTHLIRACNVATAKLIATHGLPPLATKSQAPAAGSSGSKPSSRDNHDAALWRVGKFGVLPNQPAVTPPASEIWGRFANTLNKPLTWNNEAAIARYVEMVTVCRYALSLSVIYTHVSVMFVAAE